jgi:hypothetical protein
MPVAKDLQLNNPVTAGTFPPALALQSAASRAKLKKFPKNPESDMNIVSVQ